MPKFIPHGWNKGQSKGHKWLVDHVDYAGDECLIWPFSTVRGYGDFKHLGKKHYAHRYMCELINGPAPSPLHQAAHSCGRGDQGCTHPRHVSWKTQSENQLDRRKHGTTERNNRGKVGKLTPAQVSEIRSLGATKTQEQLAAMFDTSRTNIQFILNGKTKIKIFGLERQRICSLLSKTTKPMSTKEIMISAHLVSATAADSMLRRMLKEGVLTKPIPGRFTISSQNMPPTP